jgi:hypothetical protein
MRHRLLAFVAATVAALAITGSAVAFDCIRVSSSLQGLAQSTKSGNWLLFDLSSAAGVQGTFANVFGAELTPAQAACFAGAYATSGQPQYFALGIGVAGGKKDNPGGFGVLAWNNPNDSVLGNGKGIDHIEDGGIVPAVFAAAGACGIEVPE